MTSLVTTSWMAVFGTWVEVRAFEMTFEMALKDSVDSFPPFKIAAFPDLIAKDAMFAMTSGLASNMMRSTPIGHDTLSKSSPSSSLVLRLILPTIIHVISVHPLRIL